MYCPLFRTDFIAKIGRMSNLPVQTLIAILAYIYGRLDRERDMPENLCNKVAPSEGQPEHPYRAEANFSVTDSAVNFPCTWA